MKKPSDDETVATPCLSLKDLFNQPTAETKSFDQNSLAGRDAALKQIEKQSQAEAFEKIAKFAVSPEEALGNFQVSSKRKIISYRNSTSILENVVRKLTKCPLNWFHDRVGPKN